MEGRQERKGARRGGKGLSPKLRGTWTQKWGELAPDFDFKFGGIKAREKIRTPPKSRTSYSNATKNFHRNTFAFLSNLGHKRPDRKSIISSSDASKKQAMHGASASEITRRAKYRNATKAYRTQRTQRKLLRTFWSNWRRIKSTQTITQRTQRTFVSMEAV